MLNTYQLYDQSPKFYFLVLHQKDSPFKMLKYIYVIYICSAKINDLELGLGRKLQK